MLAPGTIGYDRLELLTGKFGAEFIKSLSDSRGVYLVYDSGRRADLLRAIPARQYHICCCTRQAVFVPLRILPTPFIKPLPQTGRRAMRKSLAMFIVIVMMLLAATPALGQCGRLRHRHGNFSHTHSACVGDRHKHGRSFWQKHRDKLTTAIGAGAGAAIGGAAGGGKGAAIGAVVGGGGAAVYTYGIRKRRRSARN
jgi:hypothetical protein